MPIVAGLFMRRPGPLDALAAIGGGVTTVIATQLWNGGHAIGVFTPAMCGLAAAAVAFALAAGIAPHSGSTSPARAGGSR